jgi:putative transposase
VRFAALATVPSPLALGQRCALLGVSRSGYYAWRRRPPSPRAHANRALVAEIRRIHAEVDRTYGSPRMQPELQARGLPCGRHRVAAHAGPRDPGQAGAALAREDRQPPWVRARAQSAGPGVHGRGPQSGLDGRRDLHPWCYLAVVIDAFSRRVVGWAVDTQLTAALPRRALERAIAARRPAPGLLHHSDRGIQYAAAAYQQVLARHGMIPSMSRRGDCWDNAVVESFFGALKVERLHERRFVTPEQVEAEVSDYIERFYNRQRRHSTLGHVSPVVFELRHVA